MSVLDTLKAEVEAIEQLSHMMKTCDYVICGCNHYPRAYITSSNGTFEVWDDHGNLDNAFSTLPEAIHYFANKTDH